MTDPTTQLQTEQEDDTQTGKFLTFLIGTDVYGIEIRMSRR